MSVPTNYAAAGKIQSHGEDFYQCIDEHGKMLYRVDAAGNAWGLDFSIPGVTSLSTLNNQVQSLAISGLPSVIDGGTF